jgi:sarcosine oxidase subunit delta
VRRPDATAPNAEAAFFEYVYIRQNTFGRHQELWFHQGGCHEWLVVERDTRNHEITGARPAREVFAAAGDAR